MERISRGPQSIVFKFLNIVDITNLKTTNKKHKEIVECLGYHIVLNKMDMIDSKLPNTLIMNLIKQTYGCKICDKLYCYRPVFLAKNNSTRKSTTIVCVSCYITECGRCYWCKSVRCKAELTWFEIRSNVLMYECKFDCTKRY